ncbi:hypothetical protein C1H46_032018 [Malus baccata]|uniref:Uncharacterized protein n=1 Tax=Malus baccata TaxID=106549 RepID=A0A540L7H5_MALBA|nr:hypothetical protein C1H46_032018 [Malus baccata]
MHVIIRLAETEKRDRELLIPMADSGYEDASSKPSSSSSSSYRTGREVSFDCCLFSSLCVLCCVVFGC